MAGAGHRQHRCPPEGQHRQLGEVGLREVVDRIAEPGIDHPLAQQLQGAVHTHVVEGAADPALGQGQKQGAGANGERLDPQGAMAEKTPELVQVALQGQQGTAATLPFTLLAPHRQAEHLATASQSPGDGGLVAAKGGGGQLAGAAPEDGIESLKILAIDHTDRGETPTSLQAL